MDARSLWITTDLPVAEIGKRFGVSDTAINKRAKSHAWGPRNAPSRKRALVDAAAAGLTVGLNPKPNQTTAEQSIMNAAAQDIEAMSIGSDVALTALRRCKDMLGVNLEPRDFKCIVESGRLALEMYRRARNLDEPKRDDDEESPLLALSKSLRETREARPQAA